MLILDKARTLDLMIARAEQVVVPEGYHARWVPLRLASYEPRAGAALPAVLTSESARVEPATAAA